MTQGMLSPLFSWRAAICDSSLPPAARHVALTLSLHMNERGGSAFPSQATLARETGLHTKTVEDHLRLLRNEGWLRALTKAHRGQTVEYAATIPEGLVSDGAFAERSSPRLQKGLVQDGAQYFREDVREEPNGSSRERPRNPVWDTLTDIFGEATTETARSRRGKVCRSLTSAGATPDEMIRRAKSWGRHFDNATLTETALEKYWDTLGQTPFRLEERRGRPAHR